MNKTKKSKSTIKQKKQKSRKGPHTPNDQTDYEQMEVDEKFVSLESKFGKHLTAELEALNEANYKTDRWGSGSAKGGIPAIKAIASDYRDIAQNLKDVSKELERIAQIHNSIPGAPALSHEEITGFIQQINAVIQPLDAAAVQRYEQISNGGKGDLRPQRALGQTRRPPAPGL